MSAEEKYRCQVVGFVSDNESKMVHVRELLVEWRGKSFITYGCSAHYMNLVQNEAFWPGIKAHLVEEQKLFRNHHKQGAQLPGDTRYRVQSPLDLYNCTS